MKEVTLKGNVLITEQEGVHVEVQAEAPTEAVALLLTSIQIVKDAFDRLKGPTAADGR